MKMRTYRDALYEAKAAKVPDHFLFIEMGVNEPTDKQWTVEEVRERGVALRDLWRERNPDSAIVGPFFIAGDAGH